MPISFDYNLLHELKPISEHILLRINIHPRQTLPELARPEMFLDGGYWEKTDLLYLIKSKVSIATTIPNAATYGSYFYLGDGLFVNGVTPVWQTDGNENGTVKHILIRLDGSKALPHFLPDCLLGDWANEPCAL